jgi:hypothetical protein
MVVVQVYLLYFVLYFKTNYSNLMAQSALLKSSIAKKVAMALSEFFLMLFLAQHFSLILLRYLVLILLIYCPILWVTIP